MKTLLLLLLSSFLSTLAAVADDSLVTGPGGRETLETDDGTRTPGRLEGDPVGGFRFVGVDAKTTTLARGTLIQGPGRGTATAAGLPPFRVELGLGRRISGRLGAVDGGQVQLLDVSGEGKLTVARAGVLAVVQRPGETQVFHDAFESLDTNRWSVVGEPEVTAEPRVTGARSLRVPAGGASLTHRLEEPFGAGRLEVAFHDDGTVAAGRQWFVDLTFRNPNGRETVRVVLGWAEDSLAVEAPRGPSLAVQRLARKRGWHRLAVRFGPELCEVGVDGNELAHGKGLGGPLVEIRLASYGAGKAAEDPDPPALAGHLDDLRLVRFAEPVAGLETDATQDEVRLTGGDQLFGKVRAADGEAVTLAIDGRDASIPWAEVAGLFFRRESRPGTPVEGLLVRVDWRGGPGTDPRDLNSIEGALSGLDDSVLKIDTPYAGTVAVPRDRLTSLRVIGRGRWVMIDPVAHHLGDEVSTTPPLLDPPQPEGGVLERAVDLPTVPEGNAFLVLDLIQVVGEAADLPFSTLVKKGELRTNVKLNGEPFDYLNHYITTKNETAERVRLPIPRALLRPGKNVFRFEQAGIASDPNFLDDLGVLGIALEFAAGAGPR